MLKVSIKSLASKRASAVAVKDISFPKSEVDSLQKQTRIVTHRVSDDADKFEKGEYVYAESVDSNYCFEVVDKKVIDNIEKSPYFKELTASQTAYLRKFNHIAVLTLQKTKYERPYKLSYIKANYSEKIYESLKGDAVHSWRATTGIELIHLEPTTEEQARTRKNWRLMPKYLKDVSDAKCIELFGVDNDAHFNVVKDDKDISDDSAFKLVIAKYKSLFGIDISYMRLVRTKTPRYSNGKIVVNPDGIVKKGFAGCHTSLKIVYINADMSAVMKNYGLKDVPVDEFRKSIIAHELAHEIWENHADAKFKSDRLREAEESNFTTPYLDVVKKNSSGMKVKKETFCEFMSALICGKVKKVDASTESLKTTTKEEDSAGVKKAKAILEKLSKFKAINNCQKFAAAVELAYRGVDVEVTPTMRPDARVFDVPVGRKSPYANWCLIRNGEFTKIKKDDPLKSIEDTMLKWGDGARAIIAVTWTGSHAGHVFNLTVIDGKVYLLDGTANRFKEIHDSDYLKKNVDAEKSIGLLRTDKGSIDSTMKADTFSDEAEEFSTDGDDKKYPSVTHLLHIHGEKGKTFTIYRKDKKIGVVRCDSVNHVYGKFSTVWNYSWR